MSQLTYGVPPVGAPGLRLPGGMSISRANANAANPCPYGRMVQFKSGAEDTSVVALASASDKLAGIVVFEPDIDRTVNQSVISGDTNGTFGPNVGESMTLERRGALWVEVEATCVSGDKPFVRHTANGGNTMIGVFSNGAGTGLLDITNLGTYILGGAAGALALLAFDLDGAVTVPSLGSIGSAQLNAALLSDIVADITFAVGAETANAIAVTVQLKDPAAAAVTGARIAHWWISDTAGAAQSGTAPTTSVAFTGSGVISLIVDTAKLVGRVVTGATGSFVCTITETGAKTFFLNCVCGDGAVKSSAAITFV